MDVLTWGQEDRRGGRSYVVVSAVPGDAIERCGKDYLRRHPGQPEAAEALSEALVSLVRALHDAGLVHRDLYASHVFLHESEGELDLYLIDMARVFAPMRRLFRWGVKDLAQLKYSMPPQWVTVQWDAFLGEYLDGPDAARRRRWALAIDRKVLAMRRRAERKSMKAP
jgi:heptose I phosphotransferase